jgi:arylsulfatase A-like enzyme
VGKWGLADLTFEYRGSHPNDQGFDYFYGLAHSNDEPIREGLGYTYETMKNAVSEDFPTRLLKQRKIVEEPAHQPTLTKRYTDESVKWIKAHKDEPFFLYLAHAMPHVPIFASDAFAGHSQAGLYGDIIEELDWSVGRVMQALEEAGIAGNTLVVFSSDNGPWRTYYDLGGSPGPLRDGKLTGWEGAYRVPGIFWWPGKIKPGVIDGIGVNVDLMSTVATLTGTALPEDRTYDSIDLSPTLLEGAPSPRRAWFFYGPTGSLWGARVGSHKLVYQSWDSVGKDNLAADVTAETFRWSDRGYSDPVVHNRPLLFDLSTDISERLNIAELHPDIVADIQDAVVQHKVSVAQE